MNEFDLLGLQINSREAALFVWLVIFLGWAISQSSIRKSLGDLLKSFSHWKIFIPILLATLYSALVVYLLSEINLWATFLIKDTAYWFLGTAFVLLLNTNKATQGKGFFKKVLKDNLKVIIVLEFIVNLYTLNFFFELVLVPILFFVVAMNALAETKQEYAQVKKFLDYVLSAIGVFFIIFALGKIIGDYQAFVESENLKSLVLPPILTTAFIPFLYFFALLMAYETLFMRLGFFIKNDSSLLHFTKVKIFKLCHFNLPKLNRFAKDSTTDLIRLNNRAHVTQMIEKFQQ